MSFQDIDRVLSSQAEIIPSSGFVESVMHAVRHEASDPQPIPFPWKRSIAGILVWVAVLGFLAVEFVNRIDTQTALVAPPQLLDSIALLRSVWNSGVNWLVLALAASFISLTATKRLLSD